MIEPPTRRFVLDSFGGPEALRCEDGPAPAAGAGEVVIGVEVAGVNFGDTMIRRGEYLRDQPLSMAPGCEVVGRVIEAGEGVAARIGARVAAWVEEGGAYADRIAVRADRTYPVPDDLPAASIAAVFLQGTTAHYSIHRYGRTAAGDTVLVHAAAGGVGGIAVQLARIAGARVVATASSEDKRAIARRQGADVALDSGDPVALAERILEATGGSGCDVVVDGVGGPLFEPSLTALALGGRYVIAGAASQQPSRLDARHLLVRGQTISGFMLPRVIEEDPEEPGRTLGLLCDLVRAGELDPLTEVLPLERAAEAHRRIEARQAIGKIVLAAGKGGS